MANKEKTDEKSESIEYGTSEAGRKIGLPYSEAVTYGRLMFLAGQVGNHPGTMDLVAGGIQEQTRQAIRNLEGVLRRHGSDLEHVLRCAVYLMDLADFDAMNEAYAECLGRCRPSRTTIGVAALPIGARIEIDCVAVKVDRV